MAGGNSTADSDFHCSDEFLAAFRKSMRGQVWRVNAMLLTDVVLAGVIVAMGAYGQRYHHHPYTRFVFLGATLFLPILSYVVSSTDSKSNNYSNVNEYFHGLVATCEGEFHSLATVTWAFLVQIVVINTSIVVAADDREGRNIPPPYELFVQGRSFALGRNPHLVSGYSQQLQQVEEGSPHGEPPVGDGQHVHVHVPPPPLMVMGEEVIQVEKQPLQQVEEGSPHGEPPVAVAGDDQDVHVHVPPPPPLMVKGEEVIQVEKQPQGYVVKDVKNMVTVDRVWRLDDTLLAVPRPLLLKDLCLSFALFQLLRCRFARYKLGNAGSKGVTTDFFWGLLMKDGKPVRIFRLIADEVSFVHDYYYSIIPSNLLCQALAAHLESLYLTLEPRDWEDIVSTTQMDCLYWCWGADVRSETWLLHLFQLDKSRAHLLMGQSSVLVLQPRTVTPLGLLRRVLRLPDKERSVRVSPAVKACIIDALRSHKSTGASLRRSRVDENFPGACNSKGTSDAILTWHIATCILEARHPCQHDQEQEQGSPPAVSDDRITAVHLSRYCTYLVAWYPELLPDDVAWSKSVYKAVKKDAGRALAARRAAPGTPEAEYEQLLKLLGENSRHEVLRDGARLATELVEYFTAAGEGDEATWKLLAGFWSEMILYAAPSKNEKGDSEAVARGGELITLLWALLFHAGIVSRGETAATPAGTV
ncbi:unnamed protein product [Miscanthus lutarioriparius]|uniref:DUF4220 domain-containing protein n=1 Tax=Miscanthus lutarioriparius TaxID=422564 RepID=A0A811RCJ0_9POAL|nr:unnamed protein product [Miscanthus lutarioriparius]